MAGGGAGWVARGASRLAVRLRELHRRRARRLQALRGRGAPSGRSAAAASAPHLHAMAVQAARLRPCAPPICSAIGLKLVGGRLLPGPTGAGGVPMYEGASGERFTIYSAKAATERDADALRHEGQRRRAVLGRPRRRLCGERRPTASGSSRSRRRSTTRSTRTAAKDRSSPAMRDAANSVIENLESRHGASHYRTGDHANMSVRSIRRSTQRPRLGFWVSRAGPPLEAAPHFRAAPPDRRDAVEHASCVPRSRARGTSVPDSTCFKIESRLCASQPSRCADRRAARRAISASIPQARCRSRPAA